MKKNFLYSMMALFAMFFAACSQEEIVSTSSNTVDNKVRLTVNLPNVQPASRAALDVDGHVMRCIAQAVNAEGTLIEGFNEKVEVTNGTANFEFEAPDGVATYLFWADYVIGNDYTATGNDVEYYNATDLTSVGYRLNKRTALFNNEALDAFCANVAASGISSQITLKRPLTRLSVRSTESQLAGLNIITPSINGARLFNVANGTCGDVITLSPTDGETVNALTDGDYYFFCYVFTSDAITKSTSIKFSSESDTTGKTITMDADQMKSLDSNTHVNLVPEQGGGDEPGGDNTINVSIVIDSEYNKPADPNALAVGDYINAAGEKVTSASDAVAVVFALADGVTDNSEYGAGKVAEAYAVSLTLATASRTYATNYYSMNLAETATGSYAGYAFTQAIDAARQEGTDYRQLDNFFNSNQAPALSGDNVSGWYIPSLAQLQAVANVDNETLTATLQGGYTGDYSLATSSVVISNEEHCLQGVIVTQATGVLGNNNTIQESTSFHILPVVTIFE